MNVQWIAIPLLAATLTFAQALSTDGFPSTIVQDPCPGYQSPSSAYDQVAGQFKYGLTWIGDTWCGGSRPDAPHAIADIFVQNDGRVLSNVYYEETNALSSWKNGTRHADLMQVIYGGWAITSDRVKYSFFTRGGNWTGIFAKDLDLSPYAGGPSLIMTNDAMLAVKGMAAVPGWLFVVNTASNTIDKYATTGTNLEKSTSWSIPSSASKLASDFNGKLYLISQTPGSPAVISCYTENGVSLFSYTLPSTVVPHDIDVSPQGQVVITDSGRDRNVKFYNVNASSLSLANSFGVAGGVFAGPIVGATGPLRFRGKLNGVSFDANGNIYVATDYDGDATISSYKLADKSRNWLIENSYFVKTVDVDPGSDSGNILRVSTPDIRTTIDFSKPKGYQFAIDAIQIDPSAKVPDQLSNPTTYSHFQRRLGGTLFQFRPDHNGNHRPRLIISRVDPNSRLARQVGYISAADGIWIDGNDNQTIDAGERVTDMDPMYPVVLQGQAKSWLNTFAPSTDAGLWVDSRGGVWWWVPGNAQVAYFPFQGLNASGNPKYAFQGSQIYLDAEMPTELKFANNGSYAEGNFQIHYDAERDRMVFSRRNNPNYTGNKLMMVQNWLRGNRSLAWSTNGPIDYCSCYFQSHTAIAGDILFVGANFLSNNLDSVQFLLGTIHAYDINSGAFLGTTHGDKSLFDGVSGAFDNPYMVQAYQRQNGEVLFLGEDVWHTKVRIHRIQAPRVQWLLANDAILPGRDLQGIRASAPGETLIPHRSILTLSASADMLEGTIKSVEFFAMDIGNASDANPQLISLGNGSLESGKYVVRWAHSLPLNSKLQIWALAKGNGTSVTSTTERLVVKMVTESSVENKARQPDQFRKVTGAKVVFDAQKGQMIIKRPYRNDMSIQGRLE